MSFLTVIRRIGLQHKSLEKLIRKQNEEKGKKKKRNWQLFDMLDI